ncbi:hypothetical protein PHYC_00268 [Phycisphaerales bacterium]|nr:hypothetical protein PHYC_00268 [Phycisphaerales bacterium]
MNRWMLLLSLAVLAPRAAAQLVVGNDQATPTIWLVDVSGSLPNRALVTGSPAICYGLAADESGRVLYWTNGSSLFRAPYTSTGPLTPQNIGAFSGVTFITGLAFDSSLSRLYGRSSGGLYQIDVSTAVCTQVFAATAQDFGAFDYDSANDVFYVANDSIATTVVPGRGLYRILKPLTAPTFQLVSIYPSGEIDIDGLAVGDGIVYLVNDAPPQGIYRYNLMTNQYMAALPSPFTSTNAATAGGTWAPNLLGTPPHADLSITLTDDPDPVVPPGGDLTYTLTIDNLGPDPAESVSLTHNLPGGITFLSADPPLLHTGGVVTASLGTLANGEQREYQVVIRTANPTNLNSNASVTSSTADSVTQNNQSQASTTVRNVQADLFVSVAPPPDCTLTIGQTARYVVHARNLGPEPAENAVLEIFPPATATFLGSQPPFPLVNQRLTVNIGAMAVNDDVQVDLDCAANQPGFMVVTAVAQSDTEDPNVNNSASTQGTRIGAPTPTSAAAQGILSTLAGHPTSLVPGQGGIRFTTGGLAAPFKSESGARWIMLADTDASVAIDAVVLIGGPAGVTVVARENTFPLLPTNPAGSFRPFLFDPVLSINDSGRWAMSGIDSRPNTNDDAFVVVWNGSAFNLVMQEGNPVPAIGGGANYGPMRAAPRITYDGRVLFGASLTGAGVTPADDLALFADNGFSLLARKGMSAPFGQRDGNFFAYADFALTGPAAFASDTYGSNTIALASVADAAPFDRVLVIDNFVAAQEGVPLPSTPFTSPLASGAPVAAVSMEPDGSWFAIGSNADSQDWVLRNSTVIAKTGEEIIPGSSEHWRDWVNPRTFFLARSNQVGDFVIGGATDNSDPLADEVIVLSGERIVARENDPVDLNADGAFLEDLYIRSFEPYSAFLADDQTLFVLVRLRSGDAARCAGEDLDLGQALLRIPLTLTCDPDVNCDGSVNGFDIEATEQAVNGDYSNFCQSTADLNNDGAENGFDIETQEQRVNGEPCV